MNPKLKKGILFLPLLLLLSIAGFFLVKAVASRTFTKAQSDVEAGIQDRYDLSSNKFALSRYMGNPSTWKPYVSKSYNYAIKHPNPWPQTGRTFPGTLEFYEVALANSVVLSVAVQENFVEIRGAEKLKTKNTKFTLFQQEQNALAAYAEENNIYYIIRLTEDNYFGTEQEFKATFTNILKTFQFLD